jgi:hypothetical protein
MDAAIRCGEVALQALRQLVGRGARGADVQIRT